MSGFQEIYLGMAIGAALVFMAVLAWGQIYTRGAKKRPAASARPAEGTRKPEHKLAA